MLLHYSTNCLTTKSTQPPSLVLLGLFLLSSQETEFSRLPIIVLVELSDGSEPLLPRRDLFFSGKSMLPLRLKNPRRLGVD